MLAALFLVVQTNVLVCEWMCLCDNECVYACVYMCVCVCAAC